MELTILSDMAPTGGGHAGRGKARRGAVQLSACLTGSTWRCASSMLAAQASQRLAWRNRNDDYRRQALASPMLWSTSAGACGTARCSGHLDLIGRYSGSRFFSTPSPPWRRLCVRPRAMAVVKLLRGLEYEYVAGQAELIIDYAAARRDAEAHIDGADRKHRAMVCFIIAGWPRISRCAGRRGDGGI